MHIPRIIHTADWHLGNNRVPTIDTANAIKKHLLPRLVHNDILFIAGDIFDGKVSFNSDDANVILDLFADIIRTCYEYNVIIRILRGTYTHDLHQNNLIKRLHKKLGIPTDFKLIDTLSIEHIDKYNLNILYMPDNLPYSNKDSIFDNVRMLFLANGLKQVDYVVMHGEFDHCAFGQHINQNAYSYKDFEPLCSKLVLSGHIHKPYRHKDVIYAGSFNRLSHNEEEAKGFWEIHGKDTTFIINKDATKFITVDYTHEKQFDDILEKHNAVAATFGVEQQGFLRVMITDTNLKNALASYHNVKFPNIRLSWKQIRVSNENEYLIEKLRNKEAELLEIPSLKNIAAIVCKHLEVKGINLNINVVETLINGG